MFVSYQEKRDTGQMSALNHFLDEIEKHRPEWYRELNGDKARAELAALRAGLERLRRVATNTTSAARKLRAIPSEKRAQASRNNGKLGGRPRKKK